MPQPIRRIDQGIRKALCAVLPRSVWLRRRMKCGAIVTGQNKPGFGGRGFFIFGESLEPELEHLDHFLEAGNVFLDVGANSGVFTMKAATCVGPGGLVVAVEPLPEMFCVLQRNVGLNGYSNVRIRNFCAGDRIGLAEFWINFGKPNSASFTRRDQKARKYTPLCITLDELARLDNLSRLDYLKIDAEGAEASVLAGAAGLLDRFKPAIQAEETLETVATLKGYRKWAWPGGPNCIFLPEGHRAEDICRRLGFRS